MGDDEVFYRNQDDFRSKYRAVIDYFDAIKIALTATPALHTTEIFGKPVYEYTYRTAVVDGYLCDHDAPHYIKTKLSEEGITFQAGSVAPIYDPATNTIVNSSELEDDLKFEIEDFNRKVVNKSFNETVLHEIADNIDPNEKGKTLIFAVDDAHADTITKNGCITDKDIKYISKEDFDQINQRSKVDVGDILFAMIGTIGNPVVIEDEPNYAIKNVALFKNKGKVNPYFIKYYLESREVRDKMQKEAKGTTQKFVSLGYLRDFPIVIPSDLEQEYIVKELDELLSKEFQAVSIIEEVIDQIDLMKKSILAKAFRGELGTNDSKEESSIELLKSILEK